MPSNFIKIILALAGLSPALLLLYIVKMMTDYKDLSVYINVSSFSQAMAETRNLLGTHFLLVLFIALVLVARYIIEFAKNNFSVGRIDVKSIKPADINLITILFSVFPMLTKLYYPGISNALLVTIILLVGIVFGFTMKASYHFNATLKILLGYSHYEVQTKEEITYLMVSKTKLINRKHIKEYVRLADHMLLNVSE
jgi:hypothetical protein